MFSPGAIAHHNMSAIAKGDFHEVINLETGASPMKSDDLGSVFLWVYDTSL